MKAQNRYATLWASSFPCAIDGHKAPWWHEATPRNRCETTPSSEGAKRGDWESLCNTRWMLGLARSLFARVSLHQHVRPWFPSLSVAYQLPSWASSRTLRTSAPASMPTISVKRDKLFEKLGRSYSERLCNTQWLHASAPSQQLRTLETHACARDGIAQPMRNSTSCASNMALSSTMW